MPLIASRPPAYTKVGNMFPVVFNYGDVVGRPGFYPSLEFLGNPLSIVFVQHFRFF